MSMTDVPAYFPGAVRRMLGEAPGQWSGHGEVKLVVHTTETSGLPDYDPDDDDITGELAPHLTYMPKTREFVQDYRMNRPSESLRTFDDDQVWQLEIACYSQRSITIGRPWRIWVGDLKHHHYEDIATLPIWLSKFVDLKFQWPGRQALSYAEANAPGFRFSADEFWNYGGLLGHQHTPSPNTHWDPGAFNWNLLMEIINTEGDEMLPLTEGMNNEDVTLMKTLLNEVYGAGLSLWPADYDSATVSAVKTYLGKYTNSPEGKEGRWVGGRQWAGLLTDHVKRFGGGGGITLDQVKAEIAASRNVPS